MSITANASTNVPKKLIIASSVSVPVSIMSDVMEHNTAKGMTFTRTIQSGDLQKKQIEAFKEFFQTF